MKKEVVNKIISLVLSIIALMAIGTTTIFAAQEADADSESEISQVMPQRVYVGQIVQGISSKAQLVIEVNEDGSFNSVELPSLLASTRTCSHYYSWVQVGVSKYEGKAASKNANYCYYRVYSNIQKCKTCGIRRKMYTSIPVNHIYKNKKRKECKKTKK